jgi:hypothetical protein
MTALQKHLLREYGPETQVCDVPMREFALDSDLDQGARVAGYKSARHLRSKFYTMPLRRLVEALEAE